MRGKNWTQVETDTFKQFWLDPYKPMKDILVIFPTRTEQALKDRARYLHLQRPTEGRLERRKKRNQFGDNNPNWKDGISTNNYRYKVIQLKRYPEHEYARRMLQNAIRRGDIIRPSHCSICNKETKPHGHHSDYSKPFDVIWCCHKCHRETFHNGRY